MSKDFCKGGCGSIATHKGWCRLKWRSGKKFGVACPVIEKKRGRSISKFRLEEAKQGRNPMQNSKICRKNHSLSRNKKAAESLRKLGEKGLLPQQTESAELKEKRRIRNQKALKKLWEEGKHPLQSKSKEEREQIRKKISETLISLAALGKHPSQLWDEETRLRASKRSSKRMLEMIRNGGSIPYGYKKVVYKGCTFRSDWERITAEFLDKHNIGWKYEAFAVPYYDSSRDRMANTVPDFFLPEYNAVIEVKGRNFDSVQTMDKMDAIHTLGYNTFLFGPSQMKRIKKNDLTFIRRIKNEKS